MRKLVKNHVFWLQVVIWMIVIILPLMFTAPGELITLKVYLRRLVMPLAMLLVFYINYLWLAPTYLARRNSRQNLIIINAVIILTLSIALNQWIEYDHRLQNEELIARGQQPINLPSDKNTFRIFSLLRDFYSLSAFAVIGIFVITTRRWRISEIARKEAEVARRDAELRNLRNQVNPHFLLNTLNNIYALIAFDQTKAQEAVMELSKMMRHILYDNQALFVNLTEEVTFIHSYINLMKMRIDNHVKIVEDIDIPASCTKQISPLIIISLVDNAFKHGISPTMPSEIKVGIHVENDDIVCEICNTNYPKAENDKSGHGIGLQQVRQRLDLTYPGHYDWEMGIDDNNIYTSKLTIHDT